MIHPFEYPKEGHPSHEMIFRILKQVVPLNFFQPRENEEFQHLYQKQFLEQSIPLITYVKEGDTFPGTLSFFALSQYRPHAFKFFFEMMSRWLIPGHQMNIGLIYTVNFCLKHFSEEVYSAYEVTIHVENQEEFEEIQRNFLVLKMELTLGLESEFYSQRVMEMKGLTVDSKIARIRELIAFVVKRFPHHYDSNVFTQMQHVLVSCSDEFKEERGARHLCRIISIQYLFCKKLAEALKKNPHQRPLNLKIFRALIQTAAGPKRVLSILVGFKFILDQENFGENNLMKAIQHYLPSAHAVPNSFLIHKIGWENICLAYIEIEKRDKSLFTSHEIRKLRSKLLGNLKNRIENRLHTVFMPRNEEEVMRNILALTHQIKYVRDIPQISIIFDEQAYAHLYFTVILARLLKPDSYSVADLFKQNSGVAEYLHDRTKIMGYVRKKYAKEATVFRLKIPKEDFLRADHSIDLYKARQAVVNELVNAIGEVRDYNGGMISKQHELLFTIRELLVDVKEYDELLLENFFYSLAPVVSQALVDPPTFKALFLMLVEGLKETFEGYYFKFSTEFSHALALLILEDSNLKDTIHCALQDLQISSTELAYTYIKTQGYFCIGYICSTHHSQKREQFFQAIRTALENTKCLT